MMKSPYQLIMVVAVSCLAATVIPVFGQTTTPAPAPDSLIDTICLNPTGRAAGTGYDGFSANTSQGCDYAFGFAFRANQSFQLSAVEFLASQRQPAAKIRAFLYKGTGITGKGDFYYWSPAWSTPAMATLELVSPMPSATDTAFRVFRFEPATPVSLDANTPYVVVFDPEASPNGEGNYVLPNIGQEVGFLSAVGTPGVDVFMPPYTIRRLTSLTVNFLYNVWTYIRADRRYVVRLITSPAKGPAPSPGTISFASASYDVYENAGAVRIVVKRTGGSYGLASVKFATVNGTAIAGQDYTQITSTITWADGDSDDKVVEIPICDDGVHEGTEKFTVVLSDALGSALGALTTTEVLIVDDDNPVVLPVVTIGTGDNGADESGGKAAVVFRRTGPPNDELVVSIAVGGTATPAVDYAALGTEVVFPAGATEVVKLIEPIDNEILDGDRTVKITVRPNDAYNVGTPNEVTVVIFDDEVPVVSVWAIDEIASEYGPSAAVFRLARAGLLTEPLTVRFQLGGTATQGRDYAYIGDSATFPAGVSTVSIVVVPIDDAEIEGDETVILTLLEGSGYDISWSRSATINISDNDVPGAN
ncbi:MAG: hypothetical protein N3G20_03350 [Verrucomicrobiae bacterium]|nr:hypothetical protein [Verrucomicrobiae bacterium]